MGAKLPQLDVLLQAGINPKTGLPVKLGGSKETLKYDLRKFLRLVDEQDAVNRYVWTNLPCNITSQELERMLYYKGQLAFFYMPELHNFHKECEFCFIFFIQRIVIATLYTADKTVFVLCNNCCHI